MTAYDDIDHACRQDLAPLLEEAGWLLEATCLRTMPAVDDTNIRELANDLDRTAMVLGYMPGWTEHLAEYMTDAVAQLAASVAGWERDASY